MTEQERYVVNFINKYWKLDNGKVKPVIPTMNEFTKLDGIQEEDLQIIKKIFGNFTNFKNILKSKVDSIMSETINNMMSNILNESLTKILEQPIPQNKRENND